MMRFREWLPITGRNRVALSLSTLSLVLFLVWNCLPYPNIFGESSGHTFATVIWPAVFSTNFYTYNIRMKNFHGCLQIILFLALMVNGLVTLAGVPLWKILHASNHVRLPLAMINLFGGLVGGWLLFDSDCRFDTSPISFTAFALMALSMFASSAAIFIFKNELALRSGRYPLGT